MRKLIVFAFVVIVVVGVGYGQTREEIKAFAENYAKDSTASFGKVHLKKKAVSVQPKDLSVRVIELYRFKHIFLDAYPDTIPFNELIEPSGFWRVLVMSHNKPLYELFLDNSKGQPEIMGSSSISSDNHYIWGPLLKDYPESTDITPILFSPLGVPFVPEDCVFYFKQKGPRKIRYLRIRSSIPSDIPSSISYLDSLKDSKELIKHWKKQGLNKVGISAEERERRRATLEAENGGLR
jgi:hypothetical protein